LNKKWLIGCSIAAFWGIVIVAGVVWGIYSFYSRIQSMMPEMPPELREARVVLGSELFQKDIFIEAEKRTVKSKRIGSFEDIVIGDLDGNPGIDIVLAGSDGAAFFDIEGNKQSQVIYEFKKTGIGKLLDIVSPSIGDMQIIDIENDGKCEYLGDGGVDGAAVFDHQGKQLWSYGQSLVMDMTAGDIDGDGIKEFATLHDGIELLDKAGKILWRKEELHGFGQIEILDIEGDGKPEVIYSYNGECHIRDSKGELLKKIKMPFYLSQFVICQLPDKNGLGLFALQDGFFWIMDFEGKRHFQFEAPLSLFLSSTKDTRFGEREKISPYRVKGLWGKFFKDQPKCLAAVSYFAGLQVSVFYIYDKAGHLIYQEVLPEACHSIAVLPQSGNDSTQSVLVGGRKTVWRYKAK
jgi:hypothetical protein